MSAKKAAAERRTTLRDLIERGLRREPGAPAAPGRPKRIQWVTVDGGLPPDLDVADREQLVDWVRRNR